MVHKMPSSCPASERLGIKKVIKGPFYPFSSPFLAYIKRFKLFFPLIFHLFDTRGVIKTPTRPQVSEVHLFHIKQASLPLLQGSVVAKADFSALRPNTTFVKTCEHPSPQRSMLMNRNTETPLPQQSMLCIHAINVGRGPGYPPTLILGEGGLGVHDLFGKRCLNEG